MWLWLPFFLPSLSPSRSFLFLCFLHPFHKARFPQFVEFGVWRHLRPSRTLQRRLSPQSQRSHSSLSSGSCDLLSYPQTLRPPLPKNNLFLDWLELGFGDSRHPFPVPSLPSLGPGPWGPPAIPRSARDPVFFFACFRSILSCSQVSCSTCSFPLFSAFS